MKKIIIIWMLVFMFLITNVSSIGLTPAKIVVNFEPEFEKEISVVNTASYDTLAELSLDGDGSEYFILDWYESELKAGESKKVKIRFNGGPNLKLQPKEYELNLVVVERIPGIAGGFSSIVELANKIFVNIPTPDKAIRIYVDKDAENKVLVLKIKNAGGMKLDNVLGRLKIKESSDEVIKHDFEKFDLGIGEIKELELDIETVQNGGYLLTGEFLFEEYKVPFKEDFEIGKPKIDVGFDRYILFPNEVNQIKAQLENKWNLDYDNSEIHYKLMKGSKLIYESKSNTFNLKSREKEDLDLFFDLGNVSIGDYQLVFTYDSENYKSSNVVVMKVVEKTFLLDFVQYTKKNYLMIFIFVLVVIVNIAVIFFIIKKRGVTKKKNKP